MEKKFANLGTMLSRAQAKKVVGGRDDGDDEGCPGSCETDKDCRAVNRGNCSIACDNGKKRCDAW